MYEDNVKKLKKENEAKKDKFKRDLKQTDNKKNEKKWFSENIKNRDV